MYALVIVRINLNWPLVMYYRRYTLLGDGSRKYLSSTALGQHLNADPGPRQNKIDIA
jgi:hypothetical protein